MKNVVHLFDETQQGSGTKKQIEARILRLAMIDEPALSHGVIALVVRNDFPNARTTKDSVASTLSKLPNEYKAALPKKRPRTPYKFDK